MKFKVGDIVRFKTKEELEKIAVTINESSFAYCELPSGVCVNRDMIKEFCGKNVLIKDMLEKENYEKIFGHYEYKPNKWRSLHWNITDEMLTKLNINKRIE